MERREWKRRDWGPGGEDFYWWCTEAPEAFAAKNPVWRTLADEIVAMVGQGPYDKLVAYLLARPDGVVLPHPTVRTAGMTPPVPQPVRLRPRTPR